MTLQKQLQKEQCTITFSYEYSFLIFSLKKSRYPLDGLQMVRVRIQLLIKYTRLVEVIDADFARGMDDLLVADDDAYMGDVVVFVAKESKVARLGFLQEIDQLAAADLL